MQALLQTLLAEYPKNLARLANSVPRQSHFPSIASKIKVAIGMRRVGKTYFILQTMQQLLAQGISSSQILYLNFEDDRLLPCDQKKLSQLLEAFYQLYPQNHQQPCYFFLDEIQNVMDWSLVIRRFFDSKNVDIYITGSSAKLLSKDIATELRGRSIAIEIWPYSLAEYLQAHQVTFSRTLFSQEVQDLLMHHLKSYLIKGGFPEITHLDDIYRRQILQDYVELVILRDIIERYGIKNIILLKFLLKTLTKKFSFIILY